ncbi:5-formyltetrahydrofolate cyclo-ligase [Deltaproteobacteria bacterium TL4]
MSYSLTLNNGVTSFPMENKHALRQQVLKRRRHCSEEQWTEISRQIFSRLLQWPLFVQAHCVHTYLNMPDEPSTRAIIEYCWQQNKRVIVPYVKNQGQLGHTGLSSFAQLTSGAFGIAEPHAHNRQEVELTACDLILVPGVAFDRQGGRLGLGKGFYDRFLVTTSAFRLGLSADFQLVENVPVGPRDVTMHAVLTEKQFLFCLP